MAPRRDRIEVYRDALMALILDGGKMLPTRLMYATGLSYNSVKKLINEMLVMGLIVLTDPNNISMRSDVYRRDGRSKVQIVITEKGKYAARFISELLAWLFAGEKDIGDAPPLWLLRKAIEMKGFSLAQVLVPEQHVEMTEVRALVTVLEGDEIPSEVAMRVEAPEIISPFYKTEAYDHICPLCKKGFTSKIGLKGHIGHMHNGLEKVSIYMELDWSIPEHLEHYREDAKMLMEERQVIIS